MDKAKFKATVKNIFYDKYEYMDGSRSFKIGWSMVLGVLGIIGGSVLLVVILLGVGEQGDKANPLPNLNEQSNGVTIRRYGTTPEGCNVYRIDSAVYDNYIVICDSEHNPAITLH